MKIYAHCLVKNEENFIWYSIASIIEYVDRVMVWDNGSTDATIQIIEQLKKRWPSKISFKKFYGSVAEARQEMLDETDADWFIVLDGDEVWWEDSIKQVIQVINSNTDITGGKIDSIVIPFKNLTRDMFHFQKESKGRYKIDGKEGFITVRAVNRRIPGLHVGGRYPSEGYCGLNEKLIQNLAPQRRIYLEAPYLHLTHLRRSKMKSDKIKYEGGSEFAKDFYYPEVFFRPRPAFVKSPWGQNPGYP